MKMRTFPALIAIGLLLVVSSGCGSPAPAAPSDPNRARTVLRDVLEAWKRGDSIDSQSKLSPPVIVADEDWLAGEKLGDYRIEPNDQMVGTALRCPVTITLPNARPKGKSKANVKTRTVMYIVTTEPALRVDRSDVD